MGALLFLCRTLSTAPGQVADDRLFTVTHPFHPLKGRQFELLTYKHTWSEQRVFFHDDAGHVRSLPAKWTSVVGADPVVAIGGGRAHFRVSDLLALADLLGQEGHRK